MADVQDDIRSFIQFTRKAARNLSEMGAQTRSYSADSGTSIEGWQLEYGEYKSWADEQVGRNPYYMGGGGGHWYVFLGTDGVVYRWSFSWEESYEGGEIVYRSRRSIEKMRVSDLMGRGARFSAMRRSIERAIADCYEQ